MQFHSSISGFDFIGVSFSKAVDELDDRDIALRNTFGCECNDQSMFT